VPGPADPTPAHAGRGCRHACSKCPAQPAPVGAAPVLVRVNSGSSRAAKARARAVVAVRPARSPARAQPEPDDALQRCADEHGRTDGDHGPQLDAGDHPRATVEAAVATTCSTRPASPLLSRASARECPGCIGGLPVPAGSSTLTRRAPASAAHGHDGTAKLANVTTVPRSPCSNRTVCMQPRIMLSPCPRKPRFPGAGRQRPQSRTRTTTWRLSSPASAQWHLTATCPGFPVRYACSTAFVHASLTAVTTSSASGSGHASDDSHSRNLARTPGRATG
jgi:hypothetical protein